MKKEITKDKIRQVSIGFSSADFDKINEIGDKINLRGYSTVVRFAISELYKKVIKNEK